MKRIWSQKQEGGFTLIEILVAMVLLMVVVLPALNTTGASLQQASERLQIHRESELLLRRAIAEAGAFGQRLSVDTLMTSGNRYRIVATPIVVEGDSLRSLTVLIRQGTQWDTVLCAQTIADRDLRVLSR